MKKIWLLLAVASMILLVQSCGKIRNDLNEFDPGVEDYDDGVITQGDWFGDWEVTWDEQLRWYVDSQGYLQAEIVPTPISYRISVNKLEDYNNPDYSTDGYGHKWNCYIRGFLPNDGTLEVKAWYDDVTGCLRIYSYSMNGRRQQNQYLQDKLLGCTEDGVVDIEVESRVLLYTLTLNDDNDKAYSEASRLDGKEVLSMGVYTSTEDEELIPINYGDACLSASDYPVYYPAGEMTWTRL